MDDLLHDAEVLFRQGVLIHEGIHRGKDVRRRRRRQGAKKGRLTRGSNKRIQDDERTHDEVIAQAGCDLGEGVCGARRDEDDVCPAPELDVEDGVADGVCPLWVGVSGGARSVGCEAAYRPLIVVRPDADAGVFDVCGVEECEGRFGGDDLDFDVAVLSQWAWVGRFGKTRELTLRSSCTIRGAFMDATLPVVMRRTWVWSGERSSSATNWRAMRGYDKVLHSMTRYGTAGGTSRIYLYPSRMPISLHLSHSSPIPTGALAAPLTSLMSNNSYSLPNAKKWAKRELK